MRFRFTICDLLGLTLVVALSVGRWLDHGRMERIVEILYADQARPHRPPAPLVVPAARARLAAKSTAGLHGYESS